jgi:hypothetical protein
MMPRLSPRREHGRRSRHSGVRFAFPLAVAAFCAAVTAAGCGAGPPNAKVPEPSAARTSSGDKHVPARSGTTSRSRSSRSASSTSLIPSAGAYLGAYVQPTEYTWQDEIASVLSFEHAVGRPITIVHVYHPWLSPFPNPADRYFVKSGKVLLLSWSGTPDTRKIIAGDYDALIRARAEAVKRLGRPILMEFRHEMDRPDRQWAVHGPRDYIAAWDHIRAIFNEVGATNAEWVWCPTGYGFQVGRAEAFYPGNNEVDWVCADIYSPSASQSLRQVAQPFLNWASHTHKPVLIGEFAVDSAPSAWAHWLLAAGELAKQDPQIKGMVYFDANGTDSQGNPFKYWLGTNKAALAAFGELLSWRTFHPVVGDGQ